MDEILTTQTKPERGKERMMKILVPIFTVIFIIILVLVKIQNPEFPFGYVILIGVVILIIGGVGFFGFDIAQRFQKLKKGKKDKKILPEPADTQLLWKKVQNALTNDIYQDHIKEYIDTINHSVGKNMKSLVVEFQAHTLYRPRLRCSILINANYPNRLPTVLFEPDAYKLRQAIQSMSFDPEDPADEEETIIRNEMTGNVSTTKKKTHKQKDKQNIIEKKEGLI